MDIYFTKKKRAYSFEYVKDNLTLFEGTEKVIILDERGKELDRLNLNDIFEYGNKDTELSCK